MATLFAESEAFVLANRPTKRKPRKPSNLPPWASNGDGGWEWQERREFGE